MSYILDALKRAETEKNQPVLPIQTVKPDDTPHAVDTLKTRRRIILECLLVMILLLTVGLYYFLTNEGPPLPPPSKPAPFTPTPPKTSSDKQPQAPRAHTIDKNAFATLPLPPEPLPTTPSLKAPPLKSREEQETTPEPKKEAEIPQLIDMSEPFQQSIPPIQFKGHFYSTDPQKGSVMVGDKVYPVGSEILPGITLETVTRTGVILSTRGARFRIEVLGNWVY